MCGLIRESHSVSEGINDNEIQSTSTYSSKKINELLAELGDGTSTVELTYAEYQALSTEEKNNDITYFITDVDNEGGITGYTGGTGITVSEDKIIAIKDIKKNYIDNSNFRINQTGQSEYTTANGTTLYTVDRWYIDGGSIIPVENGVQFVNPNTAEGGTSSLIRLKQNLGYKFADFAGKTLTLSTKINGVVYSGTGTIPTEKPTTGTAIQYITAGIADFGINLNYSITGDYFVPYIALAYSRTITVEWMKLEVNSEFSGYVEPDYSTELIKMNLTTSDKGALNMPYTKAEVNQKIPSTTPVQLKVVTYDTLNSSTEGALLIENVPWSQYELLILVAGQFSNAQGTITVPTTYFNTTGTGTRPIVSFFPINNGTVSAMYSVQVYKNDDNSIYVKSYAPVVENQRLVIYGCIKKV